MSVLCLGGSKMIKNSKQKKKNLFLIILKNIASFLFGAIAGELVLLVFFLRLILEKVAEKAGLGIIALAPILLIFYGFLFGLIGGILGIIVYNVYKKLRKDN